MQCGDGVTSAGSIEVLSVIAGLSIDYTVPDIAVAVLAIELAEDGVVDSKVEGDDGVAAMDVLEGLDIVT